MRDNPLTHEQANAIYDILVEHAGASSDLRWGRQDFIFSQTDRHCSEYRFMGSLGFGGKFWRNVGMRSDGTYGEVWYVNAYSEDIDRYPELMDIIERTNVELEKLRFRHGV